MYLSLILSPRRRLVTEREKKINNYVYATNRTTSINWATRDTGHYWPSYPAVTSAQTLITTIPPTTDFDLCYSITGNVEHEEGECSLPRYRPDGIDALCKATGFSRKELQLMYRSFKQVRIQRLINVKHPRYCSFPTIPTRAQLSLQRSNLISIYSLLTFYKEKKKQKYRYITHTHMYIYIYKKPKRSLNAD